MNNIRLILFVFISFILPDNAWAGLTINNLPEKVKAIVISVNCSPAAKAGADELQHYLKRITGEELPIIDSRKPLPAVAIFVGTSPETHKAGISLAHLKPEGFIIKTIPHGLVLAGDDGPGDPFSASVRTGSLFAVYEFLERFAGVRWLWPGADGEVVPQQQEITVPVLDMKEEPAFLIRSMTFGYSPLAKNPELIGREARRWAKRQKMSWVPKMWFGHSVATHFPTEKYFQTHPEYYALVNGVRVPHQLCTSNPEMQRELVAKILNAKEDVVSISPADGGGFCECDQCRTLDIPGLYYQGDPKYPDLSQRIFTFVNQVAAAVKKIDPQKGVGIFAYTYYRRPPPKIARLEDNIYLSFTYNTSYFIDPACKRDFYGMIAGWSQRGAKLVAREYWGMHYWLDLPVIQLKGIAENLPWLQEQGFVAVYGEGGRNFANMGVNYYLLAKLMWNPRQNPRDIMADYYNHAYGPAAPVMQQYWEFLENLLRKNWQVLETREKAPGYANLVLNWHKLLPLSELARAGEYLNQARRTVPLRSDHRRRIDYAAYGLEYTKIMVQLLPIYADLQAAGVNIGFARDPKKTLRVDQAQIQAWLLEAKKLGDAREKMLFAPENINSFRLDEGLFAFAEDVHKNRPWHRRTTQYLQQYTGKVKTLPHSPGEEGRASQDHIH